MLKPRLCCLLPAPQVGATFVVYVAWTLKMTQLATEVRKRGIELENQTGGKAVDALLNYETVALFNNQVGVLKCDRFHHFEAALAACACAGCRVESAAWLQRKPWPCAELAGRGAVRRDMASFIAP